MLAAPVGAYQFVGTETQLTTDPADQYDPSISGAITAYTDRRNADADIYYFDIEAGTEHRITSGGGDQVFNQVSGQRVVYTDFSMGNAEIFIYELDSGETIQLTDDPSHQLMPAISGDLVVYEDLRNGNFDVYLFDLASMTEVLLTDDPAHQRRPAISGDIVVWEDWRNGNSDIFMKDLSSGVVSPVTEAATYDSRPDVDGDIVTWVSNGTGTGNISFYRISTGETVLINPAGVASGNPSVSGDYVTYERDDGEPLGPPPHNYDSNIWIYSISLQATEQVTIDPADQYLHDISGNRIVYTDNRNDNLDIYMFEFIFTSDNTQVGTDVAVDLTVNDLQITVTFDEVTGGGETTATLIDCVFVPPPPSEFVLFPCAPPICIDITTTAQFTGNVQVCIMYGDVANCPVGIPAEDNMEILHDEDLDGFPDGINDPGYPDTVNHEVCGTTTHLSPFYLAYACEVSIQCPDPVTLEIDSGAGQGGADFDPPPAEAEALCGLASVTDPEAQFFPVGATTLTYEATDENGNNAVCTTSVTVVETAPPTGGCGGCNRTYPIPPTCSTTDRSTGSWPWPTAVVFLLLLLPVAFNRLLGRRRRQE